MAEQSSERIPEFLRPLATHMAEMRRLAGGEELHFGINITRASLLARGEATTEQEASRLAVLDYALDEGKVDLVRKLLAEGIDPNRVLIGETLVFVAARKRRVEVVRALLEAGADPNKPSGDKGYYPIEHAASNADLAKSLLDAGADPDLRGEDSRPVLMEASLGGESKVVDLLLAKGAKVNASGDYYFKQRKPTRGVTPLMAAALEGHEKVVRRLLESGADLAARDSQGRTALDYVGLCRAKKRAAKVLEVLTSAGAMPGTALPPPLQPPDLRKAARSAKFRKALADLAQMTGAEAESLEELPGGKGFLLPDDRAKALAAELQEAMLARGCYVFYSRDLLNRNGSCLVALPTADTGEAIAAVGTAGPDDGIDAEDVVNLIEELQKEQPVKIIGIGTDFIDGQFTAPLRDPLAVARRIIALCPEGDDGAGSDQREAQRLQETGRLFLWWD